ncbi:hypothetical protein, partial [Francisella tularensis]|uniref:hypothetical protein n=1 Tax=Francisella tularensis TaxID=263 RepID=UPI002381B068
DEGDSKFEKEEIIELVRILEENETLSKQGNKEVEYELVLMGITRSTLSKETLLTSSTFKETTRVITEASINSQKDNLILK